MIATPIPRRARARRGLWSPKPRRRAARFASSVITEVVSACSRPPRPDDGPVRDVLLLELRNVTRIASNLPRPQRLRAVGAGVLGKRGGNSNVESRGTIPRQRCGQYISRTKARSAGEESYNFGLKGHLQTWRGQAARHGHRRALRCWDWGRNKMRGWPVDPRCRCIAGRTKVHVHGRHRSASERT